MCMHAYYCMLHATFQNIKGVYQSLQQWRVKRQKVAELEHHCGKGFVCMVERLVVGPAQLREC